MSPYSVGLDIGSNSIKVVVVSNGGKKPKLVSMGLIATPRPGMLSETDVDLENIANVIKNLLLSAKSPTRKVTAALPESKIYTKVITDLPYLSDEELNSAIRYSAEEFVPLPAEEVNLYWQVIERSKSMNKTQVFAVASPKVVVAKYLKVLEMAGLQVQALETDLISTVRSLIGSENESPVTLIIQFGGDSTDFAIVSRGIINTTRSIATGGLALTRTIAQYLNFEMLQAEEYKKVYGLLSDQLEGKVYESLKPLVDVIIAEANRVIQAYQTKNPQSLVKRIILTGGGAKLPGMVAYFASNFGLEIQEGNPWQLLETDQSIAGKLSENAPFYAVAVGLALRGEN